MRLPEAKEAWGAIVLSSHNQMFQKGNLGIFNPRKGKRENSIIEGEPGRQTLHSDYKTIYKSLKKTV